MPLLPRQRSHGNFTVAIFPLAKVATALAAPTTAEVKFPDAAKWTQELLPPTTTECATAQTTRDRVAFTADPVRAVLKRLYGRVVG